MRFNRPVRLAAVGAMVGTGALMMVPSGAASATGAPKPAKVVCTTLSGTETSSSFSGCTPTSAVGSGGTGVTVLNSYVAPNISATVTWGNGQTTTFSGTLALSTGKKDKCPAVALYTAVAEAKEKGAVTPGGTANVGGKVSVTTCVYSLTSNPATTLVQNLGVAKF